eukprot:SAG31_NODE_694_length_12769_cov_8.102447_3_plen_248_part_00
MLTGEAISGARGCHWIAAISLLVPQTLQAVDTSMLSAGLYQDADLNLPPLAVHWKETTGIAACGAEYWSAFKADPFGGGMDGKCALFPMGAAINNTVDACKALCAPSAQCVGFTWYTAAKELASGHQNKTSCCFRAGSVARKPLCDGAATCRGTRCYEKPTHPSPPHTLPRPYESIVFEPFLGAAPCWRVPSLVAVSPTSLLAFAGSRCMPGDGCSPKQFRTNQTDSHVSHRCVSVQFPVSLRTMVA